MELNPRLSAVWEDESVSNLSIDLTVRAVVARQLCLPPDDVTADLDLYDRVSEGETSQLLSAMGHALDVRFPDDFLDGLQTYADLTTAVRVSLGP